MRKSTMPRPPFRSEAASVFDGDGNDVCDVMLPEGFADADDDAFAALVARLLNEHFGHELCAPIRCEGCQRPAVTRDSENVPLCDKCADTLKHDAARGGGK